MTEDLIFCVASAINQKYSGQTTEEVGRAAWALAGDCLKQLIAPFESHPLAAQLSRNIVGYYCSTHKAGAA